MNMLASRGQLRASFFRWALFAVPAVVLLGFLSGQFGGAGSAWFQDLEKPEIFPDPKWFGIVWTILYAMMGLALALVGSAWGARGRMVAILAFIVQFALNLAWSPTFFAAHQIGTALGILAALGIAIAVTIVLFSRVRMLAGFLLIPYLAWVAFAGVLNYEFLRLNPEADGAAGPNAVQRVRIGN